MCVRAMSGLNYARSTLRPYLAPSWAKDAISLLPSFRIQLAMLPTPIHGWDLPGVPTGFQVFVKRDDVSGSCLAGNKVRKLEFLLADAKLKGCDTVITCGSTQSNHCRATAVAAAELGFKSHLFLRWQGEMNPQAVGCRGNLLLDRLSSSHIILVPPLPYEDTLAGGQSKKGLKHIMAEYSEKLRLEGSKPYVIPVGGSDPLGCWGYIEAFREMMDQDLYENFEDVVVATGSGGTISGLAVANYLTGSRIRVHAVCVCDDAKYFYSHVDQQLQAYGITHNPEGKPVRARDIVDIIDGYKGEGYGRSTEEELGQLVTIATRTGICLDPVYTLKGVRGMLKELEINPQRFSGRRILYIHTGGIFGLYDGKIDELLNARPETNKVFCYKDFISDN